MMLNIEQPNVMRVFEFRETPDPLIIMDYYEHGNIAEADVAYDQYVTAFGQILDGLGHLHAKGVAHRDLKPENFLVEKSPFFNRHHRPPNFLWDTQIPCTRGFLRHLS